ncbi:MAG: septation regulator SpoVG [Fibrobacterota bacterium]
MNITEVRVIPRENDGKLMAFANVVFDDAFVVRGIKVIDGQRGLFISMPSRKGRSGKHQDIAHPINNDMRTLLQDTVIRAYENALLDKAEEAVAVDESEELEEFDMNN